MLLRPLFIILATCAVSGEAVAQCPDGTPPPCTRPSARAPAPAVNSVAVLAFDNLGRDTADAYIADGLTEEITARLGQVNRLAVASRAAVRRLHNAEDMPTAQIGQSLRALYLVNGSVRHSGERLRVTVELVRATSGARLWGDQFDRNTGDLLTIEEDIARAVATGIAGQLLPAERATLAARPTHSAEAYDHYLRGLRALNHNAPAMVGTAITENEAALRIDTNFAAARASLALAYANAVNWSFSAPGISTAEELLPRAIAASERALRDNPGSAQAWLARGVLLMFTRPRTFEGAEDALRRSVALDPDNGLAYHWLALCLRRLGRFDEAIPLYEHASSLDPTIVLAVADRALMNYQRRRYGEARRLEDSAITLDTLEASTFAFAALDAWGQGDTAGARRDARKGFERAHGQLMALAILADIEGRSGSVAAARALVDTAAARLETQDSVNVRDGYEVALALVGTGQNERALALLQKTRPVGPWLWTYLVFPGFDEIRQDPRFQRIFTESRPPNAPNLP